MATARKMLQLEHFILSNGIKLPKVGLGTYLLSDPANCKDITRQALAVGYRLIDTASVYRNEHYIGQVLGEPDLGIGRDEIFITTKVGPRQQGRGLCRSAVLSSLEYLGVPQIDLVLLHWPGVSGERPTSPKHSALRAESWLDLEELQRDGLVRSIGVSNYTVAHLEELLKTGNVPPVVNQVEFHPLCGQRPLREFCRTAGIHLQAYSSLGSADGYQTLAALPAVQEIATRLGKTVSQVLLKWGLQHEASVLPKTSRVERLSENADLFDWDLSPGDMSTLDALDEDRHFCWNPNDIL